ncbi:fumarylacetoacetate hydrolase family protein [Sphingorhabdus sp.]|jgi:ureidoglycolate lyase|uniref:fumarylacetoacetate hydrolase family protein n=1 Tax=Sphingorhabdus sp. TaxID=1902408 RepID=UPI004053E0F7
MKLVTFTRGQEAEIGVVINDTTIVPLGDVAQDMIALIANWDNARPKVEALAAAREETVDIASVRLLAPVPRPGKVFAIGLNYADHVAETGMATPANQIWFTKAGTSVNGPFDPVQIPRGSMMTDYEVEMVAVIGKGGRHISKDDAASHVFGYCVGNDVSERAWQMRSPQFCLGKSFDTHAPFGPWITTSEAAGDVHDLGIRCFVNGDERQSSSTRHLIFNVWEQIAELSQAMTLEPGDVIFTGTPGGVGIAMKPMQMLKAGDVMRCEIDGLGFIEASCVAE